MIKIEKQNEELIIQADGLADISLSVLLAAKSQKLRIVDDAGIVVGYFQFETDKQISNETKKTKECRGCKKGNTGSYQ